MTSENFWHQKSIEIPFDFYVILVISFQNYKNFIFIDFFFLHFLNHILRENIIMKKMHDTIKI